MRGRRGTWYKSNTGMTGRTNAWYGVQCELRRGDDGSQLVVRKKRDVRKGGGGTRLRESSIKKAEANDQTSKAEIL